MVRIKDITFTMYSIMLHWLGVRNRRLIVIEKIIKENNYKNYVEVGSYKGLLAKHLKKVFPSLTMYLVDPYCSGEYDGYTKGETIKNHDGNKMEAIYYSIKKWCKRTNNELIRKTSLKGSKYFKNRSVDIVFIDALHTYKDVKDDITAWLPKIRKGGTICGHDYNSVYFGVMMAVNEKFGVDNVTIHHDSVWSIKI